MSSPLNGVSGPGNIPVVAAVALPTPRNRLQDKRINIMVIFFIFLTSDSVKLNYHQLLFLRAIPINPTRPEPRRRIEPGIGTAFN
jgi:hypothetical protein